MDPVNSEPLFLCQGWSSKGPTTRAIVPANRPSVLRSGMHSHMPMAVAGRPLRPASGREIIGDAALADLLGPGVRADSDALRGVPGGPGPPECAAIAVTTRGRGGCIAAVHSTPAGP